MEKTEALEKTIYNLENDVYEYSWTDCNNCNCGVLARTITGAHDLASVGLLDSPITNNKYLAFCEEAFCMTTNLPLPLVFQSFKDTGFSFEELDGLENLNNETILHRVGVTYLRHSNKSNLIKYIKAWVEILGEEKMIEEQNDKPSVATEVQSELPAMETKRKTLSNNFEFYPVTEEKADTPNEIVKL